jgi:segregation and condensation protein B
MLEPTRIKQIVEAALLCAEKPLSADELHALFAADECDRETLRAALDEIERDCAGRGCELKRVASGYRFQIRQELSPWIGRLWEDKPPRYSRALLETLSLIAYKQPVTRGDIEHVRGVTVSSNIIRTLLERDWVRVVGFREVPGRPALYGTTKSFLDYFNLRSLDELPPLAEVKALLEPIEADLIEAGPEFAALPRVEMPPIEGEAFAADAEAQPALEPGVERRP